MNHTFRIFSGISLIALCLQAPAYAKEASSADVEALLKALDQQAKRLEAQESAINENREKLERQQRELMQERERFNSLRSEVSKVTGQKTQPLKAATQTTSPTASVASAPGIPVPATAVPNEVGIDRRPDPEDRPEIAAIVEEGGVLLKKGQVVVTPGLEYSNSGATRVAITGFSVIPSLNIGAFEITQVSRDTITPSVGLRYGVTNRFEVEAKVPYLYRNDTTKSRPFGTSTAETSNKVTGLGLGDVEFGAHYQINDGDEGWPYFIGNLRVKTATGTSPFDVPLDPTTGLELELPTGTGFYAIQPSITTIYPVDPVVFYNNTGYLYNMPRDVGGTFGEIDPGDSISSSFGMSLALNDSTSFSVGYSHNTVFRTTQNGNSISNSKLLQVGSVDLGYSYSLNDWINYNATVSAGVTEDAPDVRLIFRVPMKLNF